LGLFSQGGGTFFPRWWDFLPKALRLSSQRVGKEFPPNGTNSLLRGNALKMLGHFEIRREREEEIKLLCISYSGWLCAIGFTDKLEFTGMISGEKGWSQEREADRSWPTLPFRNV
jgi:hypothetical protein